MRTSMRAASLIIVALLCGCGGDNSAKVKPPPPHSGSLVAIPGNLGLVEIVKKDSTGKEATVSGELTFYFYKDEFTPFNPAPTYAVLQYGKNKSVTLQTAGEGLVTPDGPSLFKGGEPEGTLAVSLDGKTVSIPLGVR